MILKEHNHDADTEEITRRILNKKSKEIGKDNVFKYDYSIYIYYLLEYYTIIRC